MILKDKEQLIKICNWVMREQSINNRESLRQFGIDPDSIYELRLRLEKQRVSQVKTKA